MSNRERRRATRSGGKWMKILFGVLGLFIVLGVIGSFGKKNDSSAPVLTTATATATPSAESSKTPASTAKKNSPSKTASSLQTASTPTNWYPKGFHEWQNDSNIAFRWAPTGFSCNQYETSCYKAIFISETGCPTEFYAAINLLDSTGSVIDFSNGSLPSLQPMQKATIDFQDIHGTSRQAQMSQITCQ